MAIFIDLVKMKREKVHLFVLLICSSPTGNVGMIAAQPNSNCWDHRPSSVTNQSDRQPTFYGVPTISRRRDNDVIARLPFHTKHRGKNSVISAFNSCADDEIEEITPIQNTILSNKIRNGAQESKFSLRRKIRSKFGILKEKISRGRIESIPEKRHTLISAINYRYHLLWSSGFWQRFVITTFIFFASHQYILSLLRANNLVIDWETILQATPKHAVTACHVGTDFALPLMASACCFVQLVVNLLAGGCVGFNTILGPVRPYFLSLLLFLTVTMYSSFPLRSHIIRWGVALMPESVDLWNNYLRSRSLTTKAATTIIGGNVGAVQELSCDNKKHDNQNSMPQFPYKATIRLNIPTMGCVACINKIDSALRNAIDPGRVLNASSSLSDDGKGGCATLELLCTSKEEIGGVVHLLEEAISRAGFGDMFSLDSAQVVENEFSNNQ
jgi:hypothetical protein